MERAVRVQEKTKPNKKKAKEEKVKVEKEEYKSPKAIKISQNFTQIQNKPESVDSHGNET